MIFTYDFAFGCAFIFVAALGWALSTVVAEYLFVDDDFSSFLVAYISSGAFALLLPPHIAKSLIKKLQKKESWKLPSWWNGPNGNNEGYETINDAWNTTTGTFWGPCPYDHQWTHADYHRVALILAPLYFLTNWMGYVSLVYTSIASSTIINNTESLFAFLLAVLIQDERFTWLKLSGVMVGIVGVVITTFGDAEDDEVDDEASGGRMLVASLQLSESLQYAVWGDFLSLGSAVLFGAFAVLVRVLCPRNRGIDFSIGLLLGYMGLFILLGLSPVALFFFLRQVDLSWADVGVSILCGMLGNVICDFCWSKAILLTNATVATVGLGIVIPMSFVMDYVTGQGDEVTVYSYFGAVGIVIGFVVVALATEQDEREEQERRAELPTSENTTTQEIN